MSAMTHRERVVTALARRVPDRLPWDVGILSPALEEAFAAATGQTDPREYFQSDTRSVSLGIVTNTYTRRPRPDDLVDPDWPRKEARFRQFHPEMPPDATLDEWGRARIQGDYYHFVRTLNPMASFTSVGQLDEYPWPDFLADFRLEHLNKRVAAIHARDLAAVAELETTVFETAWQLRGYYQLFYDFAENPEFAARLLDMITAIRQRQAAAFAGAGVDVLGLGDDVSMQTGMMMSPAAWREWFKPRLASVVAAARSVNPGLHVRYHSDGNPTAIIPDLIEIGINVLNPVQPECMDPPALKREFGDRLAFWGGMGIQSTMPFGTPDDVRRDVRERMATLGAGGGLLLSPTHVLEPEVPLANIFALAEAVRDYGSY